MNTPEEILSLSVVYMRIYFLGVIPSLIYNMGSGILRAVGDSRRPLYFLILACIVNIALDILFVAVLKMGVTGVAVATALSQVVSALMVVTALMRSTDSYQLILKEIRFSPMLLHNIIRIGLPTGIQSTMYSMSNLIIQSTINTFGTDTVAAWTAYGKIDGIFWMIMGAYGVAITTFVGQNFGAGKYDRIKKSVRICLGMAAFTSVLLSIVVLTGGQLFFRLFTDDPEVASIGIGMMHVISPCYITYICIEILGGTTRGWWGCNPADAADSGRRLRAACGMGSDRCPSETGGLNCGVQLPDDLGSDLRAVHHLLPEGKLDEALPLTLPFTHAYHRQFQSTKIRLPVIRIRTESLNCAPFSSISFTSGSRSALRSAHQYPAHRRRRKPAT